MSAEAELRASLGALIDQARQEGLLGELVGDLRVALDDALAERRAAASEPQVEVPMRFGMVGESPAMERVFELIERVAPANVPVLIYGETGSGKELVARALHEFGTRAGGPFLAENCAAVSPNLLESELFGHKKGAFTDAYADRDGHFVAADGGTLFLDEIGDMPLEMQAKLLRVLEQHEVRPVGSNSTVAVDVRVLAATHRDLASMVEQRQFREDLLYRLNVVRIDLPPLREREGDVAHLVRFLLAGMGPELGLDQAEVSDEALAALERAPWPGNVRELENELRRALTLTGGKIALDALSPDLRGAV